MPVCNICGCSRFGDMFPNPDSVFVRARVRCEGCHSLERHRLLCEILRSRGDLAGPRRVLHIAPEPGLGRLLQRRHGERYVAGDIAPDPQAGFPIRRLDLCRDLGDVPDGAFDVVVHNHVLEHIACDHLAVLRELDRLVAPGGVHLFSIPFLPGSFRESLEPCDPAERLARFGQTDHVRIFGADAIAEHLLPAVAVPATYDARRHVEPSRLREIGVPEDQWVGYNNNSVFCLPKPAVRASFRARGSGERHGTALFISANGIGRGHLVRQIAVASRMTRRRAVFLTMSYAAGMLASDGFLFQFLPHHAATGEDPVAWNEGLAAEIERLLDATGADRLVYDVNFVFDGVIQVLRRRPLLRAIWLRRAMWPQDHASYIGAGAHFSTILEPGDLAEALDEGPTVGDRARVVRVPPVLRIDPDSRLPRDPARADLGLSGAALVVSLDLTQTAEPAYARLRDRLLARLLAREDVEVVELLPHDGLGDDRPSVRHRRVRNDAVFRWSRAFDAAFTRCGYNTFHEQVFGGVPTIFVPNAASGMDRQDLRARWAQQNGVGRCLDLDADDAALDAALASVTDANWRRSVAERCLGLGPYVNGAAAIAEIIDGDAG